MTWPEAACWIAFWSVGVAFWIAAGAPYVVTKHCEHDKDDH